MYNRFYMRRRSGVYNHVKLKEAVARSGLKSKDLCAQAGIHKATLRGLLNGNRPVGIPTVKLVCSILGVSEAEIIN